MLPLYAAFLTGLFGSLHCVGMCGPLCMALPHESGAQRWWGMLRYHGGRIGVYAVLGLVFGLLGAGLRLSGLQAALSVTAGILLLVVAVFSLNAEHWISRRPPIRRLSGWVQERLAQLLRRPGGVAYFRLGLLNGLLPCGLVYLAIAGALALGDWRWGGAYLLFFGLGTLPLLLLVTWLGQRAGGRLRQRLRALYPLLLVGLGLWLIYRGVYFYLPNDFQVLYLLDRAPMCH